MDEDVQGVEAMYGKPWDGLVIAVNDCGIVWPRHLDYWVSCHPDKFHARDDRTGEWLKRREEGGHPRPLHVLGPTVPNAEIERYRNRWHGGSSGLYGVEVAVRKENAGRVVLCGIPMDMRPNRFRKGPWEDARRFRLSWIRHRGDMGKVRSMSGWTKEILGQPGAEWLRS